MLNRFISKISGVLLFLLICLQANATHNRAGEITYVQTGALTVTATVTTYTVQSSINADRDTVTICWGDGSCDDAIRINGPDTDGNFVPDGESLPNDTKVNKYSFTHTYNSQGHYPITMLDPNRNESICNVNFPNPDGISFFLRTTVSLFNLQSTGLNSSPILTVPPIDVACVGQPFLHNPGAIDPDGDSLSFELIVPFQGEGIPVPNYESPAVSPNTIVMNSTTGDLVWASPIQPCPGAEYNIAFYVIEHRNGIPIDTLIRDMQIRVLNCDNLPPVIETQVEYCVVAGETLNFDVIVTAPDTEPDQNVTITALGGPFEFGGSSAVFQNEEDPLPQPLTRSFTWTTNCNHISDTYYQVIFRATDDFPVTGNSGNPLDVFFLSTLKVVRIKVVGPPPEDLQAVPDKDKIELTWENPYDCEITDDEFFRGFSVWKKIGSNNFLVDTCVNGLEGRGYTKITPGPILTTDMGSPERYFFVDTDVERGRTYCYRILAEFARLTPVSGLPFNLVESLPSEEICVQLSRDVPLLTKVSVLNTDVNNGSIQVEWTKPLAEDLDTMLNPGPYVYELWRAPGLFPLDSEFAIVPGASFTAPTLSEANDTTFLDIGLNTVDDGYTYRVGFYVDNETEPIGFSAVASSVFLNIVSTDKQNILSWETNVPWNNYNNVLFIKNTMGLWDTLTMTDLSEFNHNGLTNGVEYCYYVQTEGTYGIQNITGPLFNDSQEKCGTPLDTIPPCPPALTVTNICDDENQEESCQGDDLENTLFWTNVNDACSDTDDAIGYRIYYATFEGEPFNLIGEILTATFDTLHSPDFGLAGCYQVTAIDSFFNESIPSNIVCVDNCPNYTLPNTFTPNGDQANDIFKPYPFCFIQSVEFKVFNRWGQVVFETEDPDINWDGKNLAGKDLVSGTYYYTCKVFEQRVEGITLSQEVLSGYIELISGR